MQDAFKNIIAKYSLGDMKVFFAPDIPLKKINNAVSAYASTISQKDALLLFDDTVWGGAKEGILLSRDKLFCHELLTDPLVIPLPEITAMYAHKGNIYANNKKLFSFAGSDKKYSSAFCSLLFEVICFLRDNNTAGNLSPHEHITTATAFNSCIDSQEKETIQSSLISSASIDEDIKIIFEKYNFGNENIFFSPHIPEEKLLSAVKAYAANISPKHVLVLLDNTIWGGAKEGMILTRDYAFFHELFANPITIKMGDIDCASVKEGALYINRQKALTPTKFSKGYLYVLSSLINDIADLDLTEDKRAEKELIKQLGGRHEYFFYWLMTIIPKRSKNDSMARSIDVYMDQLLYVSVQQESEAWDRDAGLERELIQNFDNATYALLRLAFSLSNRVSKKIGKNKICDYITMSDCVMHEVLLGLLFRGVSLISDSFENHSDKDTLAFLFYQSLFIERILTPFYQFKISNDKSISALKKASLQSDLEQVVSAAFESRSPLRRMCGDLDNLPWYIHYAIQKHLSLNQGNTDSKSIIMLGESMIEARNEDKRLTPYCELVSGCINNEIMSYMVESDKKLESIILEFLM